MANILCESESINLTQSNEYSKLDGRPGRCQLGHTQFWCCAHSLAIALLFLLVAVCLYQNCAVTRQLHALTSTPKAAADSLGSGSGSRDG